MATIIPSIWLPFAKIGLLGKRLPNQILERCKLARFQFCISQIFVTMRLSTFWADLVADNRVIPVLDGASEIEWFVTAMKYTLNFSALQYGVGRTDNGSPYLCLDLRFQPDAGCHTTLRIYLPRPRHHLQAISNPEAKYAVFAETTFRQIRLLVMENLYTTYCHFRQLHLIITGDYPTKRSLFSACMMVNLKARPATWDLRRGRCRKGVIETKFP